MQYERWSGLTILTPHYYPDSSLPGMFYLVGNKLCPNKVTLKFGTAFEQQYYHVGHR